MPVATVGRSPWFDPNSLWRPLKSPGETVVDYCAEMVARRQAMLAHVHCSIRYGYGLNTIRITTRQRSGRTILLAATTSPQLGAV
jgi:hypothetical protein